MDWEEADGTFSCLICLCHTTNYSTGNSNSRDRIRWQITAYLHSFFSPRGRAHWVEGGGKICLIWVFAPLCWPNIKATLLFPQNSVPAFFIQLHWAEKAKILASNNTAPKRKRGRPENMIFGEGGIHELKHLFFQKVSMSLLKPLLVTRSSYHQEGFQCFARYGEYKKWAHKINS